MSMRILLRKKGKKRSSQGLTLMETLVSILILFISMTAGMSFYFNARSILTKAMHKKMALEMASQKMEELRNQGYSLLPAATAAFQDAVPNTVTFQNSSSNFTAGMKYRITGSGATDNKMVEIQVNWSEAGAGPGTSSVPMDITLATQMAPPLP